jgi:hypothetical protein
MRSAAWEKRRRQSVSESKAFWREATVGKRRRRRKSRGGQHAELSTRSGISQVYTGEE